MIYLSKWKFWIQLYLLIYASNKFCKCCFDSYSARNWWKVPQFTKGDLSWQEGSQKKNMRKTCEFNFLYNLAMMTKANNIKPYGPRCKKTRLIRAFVICFFESILSKLATGEISIFLLASVAEEIGLKLALSETPKTGFVTMRPICIIFLLINSQFYSEKFSILIKRPWISLLIKHFRSIVSIDFIAILCSRNHGTCTVMKNS